MSPRIGGMPSPRPHYLYDTVSLEPGQDANLFGLTSGVRIGDLSLTNMIVDGEASAEQDFTFASCNLIVKSVLDTPL